MRLDTESDCKHQVCTVYGPLCTVNAVVRAQPGRGEALCLGCLHLLIKQDWTVAAIPADVTGQLREHVIAYVRKQYPDCDKVIAPTMVGCNTIQYDTEGLLADGNRVTLEELEAMVAEVKRLREAKPEEGSGKQRVWWGVFPSPENDFHPRNYRDRGCGLHATLSGCKRRVNGCWEPRPCDANGNEIEVRWRARQNSGGKRWCAGGKLYTTEKDCLKAIWQSAWDAVPVLASNPDIELDLCLGGATWEPAA